jgi:penicillin-binding protein 1A
LAALAAAPPATAKEVKLLNVSYDPTRELYQDFNAAVVEAGTARSAAPKLKRPAAGKTGTTDENRDAWFVGFTPELLAAVWVGFDERRVLGRGEEGARTALPIWVDFMTKALASSTISDFAQPAGIVVARIDPATGLLPAPGSDGIEEVFLDGTAPTDSAAAPGEETNPAIGGASSREIGYRTT